jgi:hypothetical protein
MTAPKAREPDLQAWNTTGTEVEQLRGLRGDYTPAMVDIALLTVAMCGGNHSRAHQTLIDQGHKVSLAAVKGWRSSYPNRYRALADKHKGAIEREVIASVREMTLRASEVAYAGIELEAQRIATGEVRDAGSSVRNMATAIGIGIDKILLLEGRPTTITESRSSDDVLRGLQAKGYVDTTAEELPADAAGASGESREETPANALHPGPEPSGSPAPPPS